VAAHLRDAHVAIPISDVLAVAGGGNATDARKAIRGRDDLRTVEAVEIEAWVVLALAPRVVDGLLRRRERGRKSDDGAGVQVAVRPSVEALADAGRERIVDGRMA
jgi:hypothetical protein